MSRASGRRRGTKEPAKGKRRPTGAAKNARLKGEYARYRSLTARREVVEQARRAVFHHLVETLGTIDLAREGDGPAMKTLLEFAGIRELPPLNEAGPEQAKKVSAPVRARGAEDSVESFGRRLGMKLPR